MARPTWTPCSWIVPSWRSPPHTTLHSSRPTTATPWPGKRNGTLTVRGEKWWDLRWKMVKNGEQWWILVDFSGLWDFHWDFHFQVALHGTWIWINWDWYNWDLYSGTLTKTNMWWEMGFKQHVGEWMRYDFHGMVGEFLPSNGLYIYSNASAENEVFNRQNLGSALFWDRPKWLLKCWTAMLMNAHHSSSHKSPK